MERWWGEVVGRGRGGGEGGEVGGRGGSEVVVRERDGGEDKGS